MSRLLPSKHADTHDPIRGSDPLPGWTLISKYEAFAGQAGDPPYAPNTFQLCSWFLDAGPALFDLTNPHFPVALRAGIYRFYANADVEHDVSVTIDAGAVFQGELDAGDSLNLEVIGGPQRMDNTPLDGWLVRDVLALEAFLDPALSQGPEIGWYSSNTTSPNAGFTLITVSFTPQTTFNP